ncbi:PspA/IM30 family protein [Sporosarcina sp. BI001-red]|uniref:PspA/IM30 family protein n=1 Tax=Sporosarcina sp. BI001-red TaxID=2282866 RepID=UPI000E2460DF|nr:PspA/IM30 family protein [Sporosarcina sp. BI001-red]REB06033.1 PspA/IM30 family protein [Sporosarcina sp. BI001-red]
MNELWYKFKFAVQDDIEQITAKRKTQNAADVLNETIKEAEQHTKAVGKLLERQRILRDEVTKELLETEQLTEKRTEQLSLAEATGDEALINYAKDEAEAYSQRRDELRSLEVDTTESMIALERRFESMKHKVKDMQVRRLKLMGEENAKRANSRMDRIFSADLEPSSDEPANGAFAKDGDIASMRRRLDDLTAEEATIEKIV